MLVSISLWDFIRLSVRGFSVELYKDGGHIIEPQGLFLIFSHQLGVQLIHSRFGLIFLQQAKQITNHFLVVGHIFLPDAIAAHYYKFIPFLPCHLGYLRDRYYALLIIPHIAIGFVLVVPEGSGEIQSAIDPVFLYESSGFLDSVVFGGQIWLVVGGQGDGFSVSAQDCPGIPYVCGKIFVLGHEDDNGGCTGFTPHFLILLHFSRLHLLVQLEEIFLTALGDDHFVDPSEDIGEGAVVIFQFEVGFVKNLLGEVFGGVLGDLGAPMTIEYGKKMEIFLELGVELGVLHCPAPALHLARCY